MANERTGHTLQTTALVHEAYIASSTAYAHGTYAKVGNSIEQIFGFVADPQLAQTDSSSASASDSKNTKQIDH